MPKTAGTYPFLQKIIESWPSRAKAVGLKHKQIAVLAGISASRLSRIMNGHVPNPRMFTINEIETVITNKENLREI